MPTPVAGARGSMSGAGSERTSLVDELASVLRRYWGRLTIGLAGPPERPDPDLTELLSTPFSSVDDVYDRLSAAESHLRSRGDRRAVFLTVYTAMTARVRAGIERRGRFEDPEWVRRYLVAFAERYRRALVDFEHGRSVAPAWRVAFGSSLSGEALVVQDAFLGINAHIVNDLAFALDDVGIGDAERDRRHADHLAINEVLAGLTDVVQTTLASVYEAAGLTEIDALFGRFDERATLHGLRAARAFAWDNAVMLADRPRLAPLVRWRIRTVSTGSAYALLSPGIDAGFLDQFREVERGEPMLAAVAGAVHGDGRG